MVAALSSQKEKKKKKKKRKKTSHGRKRSGQFSEEPQFGMRFCSVLSKGLNEFKRYFERSIYSRSDASRRILGGPASFSQAFKRLDAFKVVSLIDWRHPLESSCDFKLNPMRYALSNQRKQESHMCTARNPDTKTWMSDCALLC